MFRLKSKHLTLASLLIFCCIGAVHAAKLTNPKPKQEPIDIKAQYLLLDEGKGISIYKGQVLFTKGTLIIKADTVTLYYDGEKLSKALIIGSPADVQHQPENEAKVHSQANKMEYFVAKEQLILEGRAFVAQGNRYFSGEYIEYDTRQKIVTASGKTDNPATPKNSKNNPPSDRVHVIIGPSDDSVAPEKNKDRIKNE